MPSSRRTFALLQIIKFVTNRTLLAGDDASSRMLGFAIYSIIIILRKATGAHCAPLRGMEMWKMSVVHLNTLRRERS